MPVNGLWRPAAAATEVAWRTEQTEGTDAHVADLPLPQRVGRALLARLCPQRTVLLAYAVRTNSLANLDNAQLACTSSTNLLLLA